MKSILALSLLVSTTFAEPVAPPWVQQAEQGAPPSVVRLPDGRLVPSGPGRICSADIGTPEVIERTDRRWLVAVPFVAGGIACAVLCRGGSGRNITDAPPVTPVTPPPADVPEGGTLTLLGTGLLAATTRRVRDLLARLCCALRFWRGVCFFGRHAWVGNHARKRCLHCGRVRVYEFRAR